MLVPVSSVNSSMVPTPGAATLTSAEVTEVTLMNVLTSNALPPQVPASVGCFCRSSIDGSCAALAPGAACGESRGDVVPADAARPTVAHDRAMIPDQALSANTTVGKR